MIFGTLKDITNISILILLLLFCYLLIGMEIYAFKLPPPADEELLTQFHQSSFNSFLESFVSVFIILANDGWNRLYVAHYRATDSPITSTLFFFSLLIIGQFILLNLFISVLINNFEEISVKNDLVTRLTDLKKESSSQRLMKLFGKYCLCRSKKRKVNGVGALLKGENKIDEMTDENHQRELIKQDQLKFESRSYFMFSYDGMIR